MSAFLSFCNFLRTNLPGVNVEIERQDEFTFPYLLMSSIDKKMKSGWIQDELIQGWLGVEKEAARPLIVTVENQWSAIKAASNDPGLIQKFSYAAASKSEVGLQAVKLLSMGPNMSDDSNKAFHVVRWQVFSNG